MGKNKKDRKKNNWIKRRHKAVRWIFGVLLAPYVKRKYGVKVEKFAEEGDRQYLILLNHQTAYDQFLVGTAFRSPIYYVATEDIFSLGFLSKLIKFLVAPIPIKKQTMDVSAIRACDKIAKEGGTISIFPEGNRTYSGQTEYINPAIAKLAKHLKLPIAFFRIEGGYGVHPRWSDVVRKGTQMRAYVSKVLEVEEFMHLDNDTLNEIIKKELYVDETKIVGEYHHERLAEYLERVFYVCPKCGLAEFFSEKDVITCKKCGLQAKYLPNKQLCGINEDIPFTYIKDWYEYQTKYIRNLDLSAFEDKEIFADKKVSLFNVILYKKKNRIDKNASITAYNDKLTLTYKKQTLTFSYQEIFAVTLLGKNKLNIYTKEGVYQIKGGERFNAMKYVNLYCHYKNVQGGNQNDGFLGL